MFLKLQSRQSAAVKLDRLRSCRVHHIAFCHFKRASQAPLNPVHSVEAYLVVEVFALNVCLSILLSCPDVEFTPSSSLILVQISPALSNAED